MLETLIIFGYIFLGLLVTEIYNLLCGDKDYRVNHLEDRVLIMLLWPALVIRAAMDVIKDRK